MLEKAVNSNPTLSRFDSFLKGTIASINDTPLKRIVGHCPTTVETRWLSRIRSIDWILKREDALKEALNHQWIQEANQGVKQNARQGVNFGRFESLRVFAHVIYPFHCTIKYFEQDSVTQAAIFPVTNALLQYYEEKKDDMMFSPYPGIIDSIIEGIKHYISECYDWPLLSLVYLATLEGRAWFISKISEQEFSGKWNNFNQITLDFDYSVAGDPTFYDFEAPNHGVTQPEEDQRNHDILNDVITAVQNTIVPDATVDVEHIDICVMPPQEKVNVYDGALDALLSIATDLHFADSEVPGQFALWLFDPELDKFLWKCRTTPILSIWKSLSGDDRIKELRRVVSRIITARATEASVEREFSREKLILGRLRSRMSDKLLKSRSLLMESI